MTMKRIVTAILVGVAVTFLCLLVSEYLRLTGHGLTAANIFFPYSALVAFRLKNMWWLVSLMAFAQFPVYALAGSTVSARRLLIPLLVVAHVTAAVIVVYLDHYGLKVHYI